MAKKQFKIIIYFCVIMLLIHVSQIMLSTSFGSFGIMPGEIQSLPNILLAPWIHGSWAHLTNNLVGFIVFSLLCIIRGVRFYILSSLIIIIVTGILVWLLARSNSYHIGASGWIFGLWSLSIALAWFQRSFLNIVIAIFVAFFYGGMIWGVLPSDPNISFESHLFGAIAGIFTAYIMTRPNSRRNRIPHR